jgi:hypothetical protein
MKKIIGLVMAMAMVVVMAGCALGISGSVIPAGTYEITTTNGIWTLVLADGTFDYKQATTDGTQITGYRGTFDSLESLGSGDYTAVLTALNIWDTGTTYNPVTLVNQTIKLSYYDYEDPSNVTFLLDVNSDGTYSSVSEYGSLNMPFKP